MDNHATRPPYRYLHWSLPLTVLVLAALLQSAGLQHLLRYDRAMIQAGQWWRLLTGNMVHLGWTHLLMDGAALILLWVLFCDSYRLWQWLLIFFAAMLSVGVGLYVCDPQVTWYVGLSGMLHGLFAAGAVAVVTRDRLQGLLFGLLLGAKLLWEQLHGASAATAALIGGTVVVDAHLYGSIGGLAAGLLFTFGRLSVEGRKRG